MEYLEGIEGVETLSDKQDKKYRNILNHKKWLRTTNLKDTIQFHPISWWMEQVSS